MKLSVNDATKRMQERASNAMSVLRGNRIADSFYRVASPELKTISDQAIQAGILNNWSKILDSEPGQALTTSQDFGPYVMEVWPLVTAWYPDFPLKELISVQDMDKPLAYMFFSMLKTGTSKSDTLVGDVVETPLGKRTIRGKYPTGEIVGEIVTKGQIDPTDGTILAYAPLNVATIPGYVEKTKIFIGDDTYKGYNVVDGKVLFKLNDVEQPSTTICIEVATGIVSGSVIVALAEEGSTDEAFRTNYVWNLDLATVDNVQRVKEQVELRPMEATPRAIMLEWSIFSEYLKKTQFGQDIRTDNTKRIMNLLYQYQVRYIIDELFDGAEGKYNQGSTVVTKTTINLDVTNNYSLEVQVANVMKQLNKVGNEIELASGRMAGNRIVAGFNLKSWLESLPNTYFKPAKNDASAFSGPRKLGEFGPYSIYYDPMREPEEGIMTYRGSEWYDATYYLGEFMPICPTDAIALGVTVRESFVSMEAYRFDKPSCVFKLEFVNSIEP